MLYILLAATLRVATLIINGSSNVLWYKAITKSSSE